MTICQRIKLLLILLACHCSGCALLDNGPANKPTSTGLIATPASYYSTNKARYLGTKYKNNLDRLAGRIARNSTTAELQFANNISSVGGIGFFTHSATKTADERYLEVVLATPEPRSEPTPVTETVPVSGEPGSVVVAVAPVLSTRRLETVDVWM